MKYALSWSLCKESKLNTLRIHAYPVFPRDFEFSGCNIPADRMLAGARTATVRSYA